VSWALCLIVWFIIFAALLLAFAGDDDFNAGTFAMLFFWPVTLVGLIWILAGLSLQAAIDKIWGRWNGY